MQYVNVESCNFLRLTVEMHPCEMAQVDLIRFLLDLITVNAGVSSYIGSLSILIPLQYGAISMWPAKLLFAVLCLMTVCGFGEEPTKADAPTKPHVVMLVAESEYETKESLDRFAKQQQKLYRTTIVSEDPSDRNRLIGLETLRSADLLLVSVRRRTLPQDQLALVRKFIAAGKPVIGIRTASHAFSLRNKKPPEGRVDWPDFDQAVFGGNYTNHHGNDLTVVLKMVEAEGRQQLLHGIDGSRSYPSSGSLYRVSPLVTGTVVLMTGQVEGHPPEPVAWTFQRADGGKSFYTSLGHVDDFKGEVLPGVLTNAIAWGLQE